jgi:putative ABC transport system permease protein
MAILAWLKRLTRRRLDEQDFDEEIRAHLAIATDEGIADGADRQTARYAALKDFGNVTLTTEAARHVWTPWWLDALHDLASDVRYAYRALAKRPGFSLTVIGVLTLGIGLNAVVFTMLKGMALSPLGGVDHSARLVVMYSETNGESAMRLSYPDYQYLRDHNRSFSELMGSSLITAGLGRGRGSRSIWGELVTGNYFHVLGIGAELGRTILPSDEVAPGGHPIVVISDGLWRSDFNADPDILGKTIELNHFSLTVVGVADPRFHGTIVGYDVEAFAPVMMIADLGIFGGLQPPVSSANVLASRTAPVLFPQGFLRPGATMASAAAEAGAIWDTLWRGRPVTTPTEHLQVVNFARSPTGGQTYLLPSLLVMNGMGLLVLAIACANIAGLVVVRGLSRRGEIAMRLALGATRMRIVRLLVVETLVLALPAALLGVAIAARGIPIFSSYAESLAAPERLFFNMGVDRFVIGFAVLAAVGSALIFGFMPALRSSRVDLLTVMNEDFSPRGAARGRLRGALVVAQVAVSLLLLVGASLMTRSLEAARSANPGFDARHTTAVGLDLRQNGYDPAHGLVFYRHLLDVVRADANVESATLAAIGPLAFLDSHAERIEVDGYAPQRDEDLAFMFNTIAPDYFRTLRIPVPFGREFEDRDDGTSSDVAIVNATFADRFWGGGANALGRRIRIKNTWRTIVGVAADIKYSRIDEAPRPYVYVPLFQSYLSGMILHTRGFEHGVSTDLLVDQARTHVVALDADLPIMYAKSLGEQSTAALFFFTLTATMLFIFGTAGMALAAMGLYGLVSYTVKQSTHEIGIRMALGASARSIVRGFLARGVRLGTTGAVVGIFAALGMTQLLRSALYGVSATDAVSFVTALGVVLGGVLLATIVPAWRASRTDPLRALRHQ